MMTLNFSRPHLNQMVSQSLLIGAIAALGLLSGFVPGLSKDSPTLSLGSAAYAQQVSQEELTRYVRVSIQIEKLRLVVYDEIKRVNGGTVPPISSCSTSGLSSNVAGIWQRFCEQSEALIKREGFTNSRYNDITRMRQQDPNLEQRVRQIRDSLL
jgi:hypothetical protein